MLKTTADQWSLTFVTAFVIAKTLRRSGYHERRTNTELLIHLCCFAFLVFGINSIFFDKKKNDNLVDSLAFFFEEFP